MSEDSPAPVGLAPGSRVAGYLVQEPLGAGGMAVVYRARDERLGRLVALKVLAPALAADEEFRRRFTAESRAAAAVDHPHVIPVYEAGGGGPALFIAMRLVTGGDLRGVLAREGQLAPERAAGLLSPVASALDAAHRAGLVHRDVKPANVLVDSGPGRPEHLYLSDFGISKGAASSAGLTGTGQYLGTPYYMSPEQVKGHSVDGRADQYALACVAWELLTGAVPFPRDEGLDVLFAHLHAPVPRLDALRADLPAAADQVLARALAKEPRERYPTCGEFTDALREALALPSYRPAHPATPARRAAAADLAADGHPGTAAGGALGPTQDITAPGQRLRAGPGQDSNPARPARRRRYLTITLAGSLLAAATAVALLLATSGVPQSPAGPRAGPASPTVSEARTESATPSGPHTAAPTASAEETKPAPVSNPLTGTLAATLANPASQGVRALAFARDGTTLAAGDFANTCTTYLWDTATRKISATLLGPSLKQVTAVAFSPDGPMLAVGDSLGHTYLWDAATHTISRTLTDPGTMGVTALAFDPGGTTVAVGDGNGYTFVWGVAAGNIARSLPISGGAGVTSVAFSKDGTYLATGAGNGLTYLWDARVGELHYILPVPTILAQVNAVTFSSKGTTLAVGDINGKTYLWNAGIRLLTATFTDPASKGVDAVAFSPDGTTLAVGDENGTTYLWNVAAGKVTATLTDPASQGVTSVAFAPDGTTLAAGDQNGKVYLWRISRLSS